MSRRLDRDRAHDDLGEEASAERSQRLDKWMWFARVTKTRTLATELVAGGKVRINGARVEKAAAQVKLGDTVSVVTRERMRVLVVSGFAERRGSAEVAAALFEDKSPAPRADGSGRDSAGEAREPGSGRPTKRDRRSIERFKRRAE